MRFIVDPDRQQAVWCHPLDIQVCGPSGWTDCTEMGDLEFLYFMAHDRIPGDALARALLEWYRVNHCDDNPRSAWHTLHRNGPLALTACSTPQDFDTVANAMSVAAALCPPHWAGRDMIFTTENTYYERN